MHHSLAYSCVWGSSKLGYGAYKIYQFLCSISIWASVSFQNTVATSCSWLQPVRIRHPFLATATNRYGTRVQLQPEVQLFPVLVWLSCSFFSIAVTGPHKTTAAYNKAIVENNWNYCLLSVVKSGKSNTVEACKHSLPLFIQESFIDYVTHGLCIGCVLRVYSYNKSHQGLYSKANSNWS